MLFQLYFFLIQTLLIVLKKSFLSLLHTELLPWSELFQKIFLLLPIVLIWFNSMRDSPFFTTFGTPQNFFTYWLPFGRNFWQFLKRRGLVETYILLSPWSKRNQRVPKWRIVHICLEFKKLLQILFAAFRDISNLLYVFTFLLQVFFDRHDFDILRIDK